jgi:hypothetical protein
VSGRVATLLGALPAAPVPGAALEGVDGGPLEAHLRATPAGPVRLPVTEVPLREGVKAAEQVDRAWLAAVDHRRAEARRAVVAVGREAELEAALGAVMLAAVERLDPADDADVDAHVASGARLWLLTGAVASALAGPAPDPFEGWARLVLAGWWPVGPSGGRLVVSACEPRVVPAAAHRPPR